MAKKLMYFIIYTETSLLPTPFVEVTEKPLISNKPIYKN